MSVPEEDGQHRNPSTDPRLFTTTYFHRPQELAAGVEAAGFTLDALLGIEGPGKYVGAGWADALNCEHIIAAARAVEAEPSLLGDKPAHHGGGVESPIDSRGPATGNSRRRTPASSRYSRHR